MHRPPPPPVVAPPVVAPPVQSDPAPATPVQEAGQHEPALEVAVDAATRDILVSALCMSLACVLVCTVLLFVGRVETNLSVSEASDAPATAALQSPQDRVHASTASWQPTQPAGSQSMRTSTGMDVSALDRMLDSVTRAAIRQELDSDRQDAAVEPAANQQRPKEPIATLQNPVVQKPASSDEVTESSDVASVEPTASVAAPARKPKSNPLAAIEGLERLASLQGPDQQVCKDGSCKETKMQSLGTTLKWADSPADAYQLAREQDKLVYLIHVSGNFEIPGFT